MNSANKLTIQHSAKDILNYSDIAIFDVQTDFAPTKALLHKESRFLYIISGMAKIKIQGKVHEMKKGILITLLPWQVSEIIEVTEPVSYYLLIYKFDFINNIIKQHLNINNEHFNMIEMLYSHNSIIIPTSHRDKILRLFEDIRDEIGIRSIQIDLSPQKFSGIYLISRLSELLVYYMRFINTDIDEDSSPMISEEIFKYMYLNLSNDLSLTQLSNIFYMSESSISKYIKNMTGLGFYDLINEMKLSKAQFLLLYTNLTLEDISALLKFSDSSQLSKIFSSNYGIGTKKFRDAYKNAEALADIRLDKRNAKIIEYIYEHYDEDIDITDISKLFNIQPKILNQILTYYVELNFSNFLNTVRINKACSLLLNTNYSITDIAFMVGFNSTKSFTRNFTKLISLTPSEFRTTTLEQFD